MEAAGFFRTLYGAITDRNGDLDEEYELEIRPFDVISQPHKLKDRLIGLSGQTYIAFTNVDAAAAAAAEHDLKLREVYFGVQPRKRGAGTSGNDSVHAYVALMADIDVDKHGLDESHVVDALHGLPFGMPGLAVRSGGGIHAYWIYKEPVSASDPDERAKHEDAAHLIRWHIHQALHVAATDDMSTRDRILRVPGTHNRKRDRRRADGTAPEVRMLWNESSRFVTHDDVLSFGPTDINWRDIDWDDKGREKHRARAASYDPADLPTAIPERLKRVIAAAGITLAKVGIDASTRGIKAMVPRCCPACGDTRGKCFITAHGRLKSHRNADCPAGHAQAGSYGIPLNQWVARYAPHAKGALVDERDAGQLKRPMQHRVAIAWGELALEPGDGGVRAWLTRSGFHAEIGDQIIEAGLALCPIPDLIDEGASRLAHGIATSRNTDEILIAVQDLDGQTRLGAWLSDRGNVRMLSHLAIESLGDMPEGLGVLGDLPAAVAAGAAGRTVVVALDPRDWLTAQGMRHAGLIDAEVVGVLRQRDAVAVCQALKKRWTVAGVLPRRVVILRRREFTGTIAVEAAKRLAGRAGVALCDLTTPEAHRGGLTESAARFGPESAARAIKTAAWRHEPAVDIATSGPALTTFLNESATMAMAKTTHGKLKLVVSVVDPGGGKTTAMLDVACRAYSGQMPVVINGRRPHSIPAEEWPPTGRRVGFWLPTHALATEKLEQLMAMGREGRLSVPTVNAVQLKGALEWCAFRHHVKDVFPVVGRRGICGDLESEQRCPEAEMGCLGAIEPRIEFGQLAFGSHAMSANVKQDLAIIDESPGVFDEQAVDATALASLFTPRIMPRVKRWRLTENEDAPKAARLLSDVAQAKANEHVDDIGAGRADGYERHIRGAELVALIDGTPGLAEALRVGAHKQARKPPVPFPNEVRAGAFALSSYPSRAAFYALQALWTHYLRLKGEPEEEELVVLDNKKAAPDPIVVLTLRTDRTWAVQQLQVRRLPDCPVVMLDATGEITLEEWKAAYPDRDVVVRRMRVQGTAPALALHLATKQFRRSRIWQRDGSMTEKTAARLRSGITRTVLEARRKVPSRPGERPVMGVLLYKGLWDLITGATPPRSPAEQIVAGIKSLTDDLNVNVLWGYFGKHDRGTNEFENVAAFLTMGDPLENLGHVELQAGLLGLDSEKVGRNRMEATLVQAIFRARHTRRGGDERPPVVLVHVGERPPDIDGLDWDRELLIEHKRPNTSGKLALAYAAVEYVAEHLDDVVGPKIMTWFDFSGSPFGRKVQDEISYATWHDACRRYAHARKLVEVSVRTAAEGRPSVLFGPSVEMVEEVAKTVFGLKSPINKAPQRNSGAEEAEKWPNNDLSRHETTGRERQNLAQPGVSRIPRNSNRDRGEPEPSEGVPEAQKPPDDDPDEGYFGGDCVVTH